MPKFEMEQTLETRSAYVERRRLRRMRMIVELTANLISSDSTVSHREARCLVDCARKAVVELYPGFSRRFDDVVLPHLERILQQRWPDEELRYAHTGETVN